MPKFVPRQRKHKVIARQKQHGGQYGADDAVADANAAEILPAEQREREQKKAAMKGELVREAQGKMSGKKKKRLDKYIVSLSLASCKLRSMLDWKANCMACVGYQTQERREPCAAQETRRDESGYEFVPELEEVGAGRGYAEGEVEKGYGGEEGGCGCGEE
jgi:hypothetical protein